MTDQPKRCPKCRSLYPEIKQADCSRSSADAFHDTSASEPPIAHLYKADLNEEQQEPTPASEPTTVDRLAILAVEHMEALGFVMPYSDPAYALAEKFVANGVGFVAKPDTAPETLTGAARTE